jgi:hypothetical protein
MEKRFDIPRTIGRMAPKHAATAAVFRESQQLAYGVLTNVSVTGACIVTNGRLAPGATSTSHISFAVRHVLTPRVGGQDASTDCVAGTPADLRSRGGGRPGPGAVVVENWPEDEVLLTDGTLRGSLLLRGMKWNTKTEKS